MSRIERFLEVDIGFEFDYANVRDKVLEGESNLNLIGDIACVEVKIIGV